MIEALRAILDGKFSAKGIKSRLIGEGHYGYLGKNQDYGKFRAVFFEMKSQEYLLDKMDKCIWHNDSEQKDLLAVCEFEAVVIQSGL